MNFYLPLCKVTYSKKNVEINQLNTKNKEMVTARYITKSGDNSMSEEKCTNCGRKCHKATSCFWLIGFPEWLPYKMSMERPPNKMYLLMDRKGLVHC